MTVNEVRANMGLTPLTPAQLAQLKPVAAQKKTLGKDAGDDDEDEEEGDETGDEDGDENSDAGDSSDFDAQHPRWPAGSPGGIGGEFAPKDAGDATQALHDAIAADAQTPGSNAPTPIDPARAMAVFTNVIENPSPLPAGSVQVAGIKDIAVEQGLLNEQSSEVPLENQSIKLPGVAGEIQQNI